MSNVIDKITKNDLLNISGILQDNKVNLHYDDNKNY